MTSDPGLLILIWTSARAMGPVVLVLFSCSSLLMAQNFAGRTPPATRTETVEEKMHGVSISDPYRWLEDGESLEVRQWTEAQNAWTSNALAALPNRARIQERLSELFSIGTVN
ncbi:MAG: prolyl oligopeptidase, partial [Blastocatellia bacterium]|nr:prolyl oligopeptidase [Blastocatellia bacterium]